MSAGGSFAGPEWANDPNAQARKQTIEYWQRRAENAEREVVRLQEAWAKASDLIGAARHFWQAMEKITER